MGAKAAPAPLLAASCRRHSGRNCLTDRLLPLFCSALLRCLHESPLSCAFESIVRGALSWWWSNYCSICLQEERGSCTMLPRLGGEVSDVFRGGVCDTVGDGRVFVLLPAEASGVVCLTTRNNGLVYSSGQKRSRTSVRSSSVKERGIQ